MDPSVKATADTKEVIKYSNDVGRDLESQGLTNGVAETAIPHDGFMVVVHENDVRALLSDLDTLAWIERAWVTGPSMMTPPVV